MAVTGKTGADAFYKAVKKQAQILAHYGLKLIALAGSMHALGLLDDVEYAALTAGFTAVTNMAAALKKMADYSGF